MAFKIELLQGAEARRILAPLAALRIEVFHEYPYLYEGNIEYELKYLDRYFSSKNSLVVALWNKDKLVGASTAIHLPEENLNIRTALNPFYKEDSFVYFGESIIQKKYRGNGFGKKFFELRENFARSIPKVNRCGFCSVQRSSNDPRKPDSYFSPENLWSKLNYQLKKDLTVELEWKEIGEAKESPKSLQFWIKNLT
ncbi:MAG: GNAT family N-acetyltransferase [Bdellovibrionota bacterium]